MKRGLLLFLFCVGLVRVQAQPAILKGAEHITPQKGQSYYWQRIPLKGNAVPDIQLVELQTKMLHGLPPDSISLENSFTPDIFVATERKQHFATLKVPLYRRAGEGVEQLTGYKLSVTYSNEGSASGPTAQRLTGTQQSVLAQGNWYKIAVPGRGLYKIDYGFLQQMGIDPAAVNPKNIRIYGNGGTNLPETVSDEQPDDLIQNAIEVHASGSSFGKNDYVLFYADGHVLWAKDSVNSRFVHTNNHYEDKSYYFLNFDRGQGLSIASEPATGTPSQTFTTFNDYTVYDRDSFNIASVGRTWWSNQMNAQTGQPSSTSLSMDLGAVVDSVFANVHVGNTNAASGNLLTMKINGQNVQTFSLSSTSFRIYYAEASKRFRFRPNSPKLNITFDYSPVGEGSAYLDFIELNYQRPLSFTGQELNFRSWASAALPSGQSAGYRISNAPSDLKVWDITNPLKPVQLEGALSGQTYQFTREGGRLREFIAFKGGGQFPTPQYIGPVANQNLHALPQTDLLIITNVDLKPAAEELADFHRQQDGISVTVATVDKIYNEFSSGGQDIGGIRNFIKMFYDRAQGEQDMIKNVLLLGSASYDFKDIIPNNTNRVPTYETLSGGSEDNAFSTDDYFAVLDPGENVLSVNNLLDVGVGRIPAANLQEAQDVVAKIKHYAGPASFGPWKNVVSFVADDHDYGDIGNMNHLDDCETISNFFFQDDRIYNLYKIYADAYNKESGAGGIRYPDVNRAINDRIFNGTFLMSYSGHGDYQRWAHEAILTPDDYDKWENINQLPVMFTGTCDFGRFDNPGRKYAGVKIMMNPKGGSIAIVTTTQAVYQSGNTQLGVSYMKNQFGKRDSLGHYYSLGEGLRQAKNDIDNGIYYNKVKYVLLGDPALRLPIPELKVGTDSLLMESGGEWLPNDTLKALGNYALAGSVTDIQGQLQHDFNGSVYVTIFDKPTTIQTVNTVPNVTPTFRIQNNIVAKARAQVRNGRFRAEFIVPKDINYDVGLGKISYYANSDTKDASGLDTTALIGGNNPNAAPDDEPPLVNAYIDNNKFRDGGVTGPDPMLYVELFDDHGINVSGGSVGHDLVAIVDDDIQSPIVMNDYYQTEEGDFRKGYVYFPMYNLPEGEHTIRVKAWDTYNNSGEGSVRFVVKNKDKGFISDLYNYPNPVTDVTHFVFQHNQSGVPMEVSLKIYNPAGALQWSYQEKMKPEGNRTEISWDGTGTSGQPLARGVYFYKLQIQTEEGQKATAYQKLVLMKP